VTVYVDNARNPYGRMLMSHLIADSLEELAAFAGRLGLRREWRHGDHFDVCQAKRREAVQLGAIEVSEREVVAVRRRLRS
jgi:hypothetical protein